MNTESSKSKDFDEAFQLLLTFPTSKISSNSLKNCPFQLHVSPVGSGIGQNLTENFCRKIRSRIISLAVNETLKFDWLVILLTVGGFLLGLISFCCFVSFQHVKLHNPESIRKLTLRDSMSSRRETTSVTPRDSLVKKRFENLCEEIV